MYFKVMAAAVVGLEPLLQSIGPSARIFMGRKFHIVDWIRTGLIDLANDVSKNQPSPQSLAAGPTPLDMTTIANIYYICLQAKVQHGTPAKYLCQCHGSYLCIVNGQPYTCKICGETFRDIQLDQIMLHFKDELTETVD